MTARRWLSACMLLPLGVLLSCQLGCGRYGPPRRTDRPPTAGAPTQNDPQPQNPDEEQRDPRRAPRR